MSKRTVPVQPIPILILEFCAVGLFCLFLGCFIWQYSQNQALSKAISKLEQSDREMGALKLELSRFARVRNSLLACDESSRDIVWQKVSARFQNPEFFSLMRQLLVLDRRLMSTGDDAVFVLEEMALQTTGNSSKSKGVGKAKELGQTGALFSIRGYLTDLCSGRTRWPENI